MAAKAAIICQRRVAAWSVMRRLHRPIQRDVRAVLNGREYDRGPGIPNPLEPTEALPEQPAEGIRIRYADLHEVAIFAGDVVNLLDFRELGDRLPDATRSHALLGADEEECSEAEAQGVGIEPGFITGDNAARFKLADPVEDGGGGHVQLPGDIRIADAGVALEQVENAEISSVEHRLGLQFRTQ